MREIIQVRYVQERKLAAGDPRFLKYIRTTRTDANGNFVIRNLPAGTWYVTSTVTWHFKSYGEVPDANEPGGFDYTEGDESRDKWVWNKVTVGAGQTAQVALY